MSVKKAFDQTIRDIKREVNKKVLKVPSIERKVLDATSNEPWGPHGSLLADIALASRNFHEYQMIMAIIWKRINDTGKNWRHVYKALTVLEYLVAHGSDRVIDDIREHAYQISTLSDFQYLDSSGRDQGNNVRRKSQTLVILVNDKERIQEVRQKAASNRDKFRNSSAMGGMYRPGSGTYGDDRYESRYEDRNGYGREREWGYRDDESYNRYGDSYSREGDRSGRDSEERYGGESYTADYQYGSRNRSSDRDADHAYDADDHHSSRGSSVKADDHSQDGRQLERKFSEQNLPAPPSYEEAVDDSRSPTFNERDGEMPAASAPISSSPTAAVDPTSQTNAGQGASSQPILENDTFDEFDPRGFVSAAPATSNNTEMDLLGSLSDSFSPNPLAIMPASSGTEPSEVGTAPTNHETSFMGVTSVNATMNQSFEDPFGDTPFKVSPSTDEHPAQPQHFDATASFEPPMNNIEQSQPAASKLDTLGSLDFGDTFPSIALDSSNVPNVQASPNAPSVQAPPLNPQFMPQEPPPGSDVDILAGILPPTGPPSSQEAFAQPVGPPHGGSMAQSVPTTTISAYNPMFIGQSSAPPPVHHRSPTNPFPLSVSAPTSDSNLAHHVRTGSAGLPDGNFLGNLLPQVGSTVPSSSQPPASTSAGSSSLVPQQLRSDKFETKSAVWADTLSRGLVNLNISGSKINPLADIGIDFEALNRKEKRMEKPSMAPTTSNLTMGKAMGSGSGVSRSGAGSLMRPSNPLMGSGMGMGMNMGIGMGSYGAPNQPMGMGMNMGMGQGAQMQHPHGLPPGSNPSVYNPMMGTRGYAPQQPYGGGYR